MTNSKFIEYYEARGEIDVKQFRLIVLAIILSLTVNLLLLIRMLFKVLDASPNLNYAFFDEYITIFEFLLFVKCFAYIFIGLYIYKIVIYIVHASYSKEIR